MKHVDGVGAIVLGPDWTEAAK